MTDITVFLSLVAMAVILAVVELWHRYMSASSYKRIRFRKRIKCFFGKHEPGTFEDRVGGRKVQMCDWCGKDLREYQVTIGQAKSEQIIRRVR